MDVTGLSIQDILNMDADDLARMNKKDLKSITNRLVSASNKRIHRLEKSTLGQKAPAYESFKRYGKKVFSVKGKNRNDTLKEFARAKRFLKLKTSTLSGWKKVIKEGKKELKERYGTSMNDERIGDLFSTLHKLQESGQVEGRGTKGSFEMRDILFNAVKENPDVTPEDLMLIADKKYTEWYEQQKENEDEDDGFSIK